MLTRPQPNELTDSPGEDPVTNDRTRVWLRRCSLAAGIAYAATAEYELARRLGAAIPVAVMLPIAIDCYLIAALRWFKALDVCLSLGLMSAAQVAAHALDAHVITVSFRLVVVVSLLVPVALWRTHALARGEHSAVAEGPCEGATPVEVERVPDVQPTTAPQLPAAAPATPDATLDTDPVAEDPHPVALMTVADVAKTKGVAEGTVRSWVAREKLTPVQRDDSGRLLFHPRTVAALDGGPR